MNMDRDATSSTHTREFVPYVENNLNYVQKSPSTSPTRTYSSPLMGKSARAARRRLDGDTTRPTRIDGIDTYNHQSQNLYQNVVNNNENQRPLSSILNEPPQQSFSAKRDFFEQRFKPASTYDSPPRDQQLPPQIITTITTTTSTPSNLVNRTSIPSMETSPTVNHLLEQATEIQKRANDNSNNQNTSQQSLVIERTEQCQVYLDRNNHDSRHTSPVSARKSGQVTDLDQAQTQINRLNDDHQAIQQLTRALQEHQPTTPNTSQRLASPGNPILINTTTTTTTTIPTDITLVDRNNKTVASEFTVIDALLDNPIGTHNSKQNDTLHTRFNTIITNLQNADYMNILRRSITGDSKRKKSKQERNQLSQSINDSNSEQMALIDSKQNKKNKKKNKNKPKKTPYTNYEVIDAIINSPITLRLPESFLRKYNVRPPASQLSPTPPLPTRNNNNSSRKQVGHKATNETDYNLVNVVDELMVHHTAAPTPSFPTNLRDPQYRNRSDYQQHPTRFSNQPETAVKPRIIYRYIDERGNVLKYSSVPPSQLREVMPNLSPPSPYQNVEPKYFNSRQIIRNDNQSKPERRTWQDHTGYSPAKRDDIDYQDKRKSQLSERSLPIARAVPVTIERETPSQQQQQQQRLYHYPNQQNLKLSWLPLSTQRDQPHISHAAVDYETDSTTSDHSITYRTYDYKSNNSNYNNRPLFRHDYYQNRSPSLIYNQSPTRISYDQDNRSPDYSSTGLPRNYIEVFRDGAANPSEIYSLPLTEPIRRTSRHSRYDKHQAEKSGRNHSSPNSKHKKNIPSSSSPSNHDLHYSRTTQGSPNHDSSHFDNYLPQSKSFDYRPLRTKLQLEYKITPSLLVDEWDHPDQTTPASSYKTTSVSSPDDVFPKSTRKYKA